MIDNKNLASKGDAPACRQAGCEAKIYVGMIEYDILPNMNQDIEEFRGLIPQTEEDWTARRKRTLAEALKYTGHKELMDPLEAIEILKDLVDFDQSGLTEMPEVIAGHDRQEVSGALVSAALEIISHDWENWEGFYFGAHKELDSYELQFSLHDDSTHMLHMAIYQANSENNYHVVENSFVYDLREWGRVWNFNRFAYYRGENHVEARADGKYELFAPPREMPLNEAEVQLLLLGIRWTAANLLTWNNPEIVWPEDLLPADKYAVRFLLPPSEE